MDKKVYALINEQIQKELYSAYLYFDISNYYKDATLDGFANWFYVQAQEEMSHAMLFKDYLLNNDEKVRLLTVDAPLGEYKDFSQPLDVALKHEKHVTSLINAIYATAQEAKDYRAMNFLNWFINEQMEEEKNASDLIQQYRLFGGDAKGLYSLDNELKARVYVPPSLVLD